MLWKSLGPGVITGAADDDPSLKKTSERGAGPTECNAWDEYRGDHHSGNVRARIGMFVV